MAAMEERMIVSGGDEVRVFAPPKREPQEQIRLEGAGALCVSHGAVFCASDWGDTVWRLDAERLVPTGLFAGGPGMKRILSSPDGTRLLLLCAEADSVLLLDAGCGLPLVLARAGLNPQNIALDETGDVLAVAAGESGEVLLMSARSLTLLRRLSMPGMVFDVTLCGGTVHALCLNDALDATLVTGPQIGARQILPLPGMPGRVAADGGRLLCATEGFLHAVSRDGMRLLHTEHAPGRAGGCQRYAGAMLLFDGLSERIFARSSGGCWNLFCGCARDMQRLSGKG